MSLAQTVFKAVGKTNLKVVAIFIDTSAEAATAIKHVRAGGVELPIYLYCREAVSKPVADECAAVTVRSGSYALVAHAQRELWHFWVALGITAWTGKRGNWLMKTAPFLFPPFRVLLVNENEDFFAGGPGPIWKHASLRMHAAIRRLAVRSRDVSRGLMAYPFAFVAQWYSPLSRSVFRGIKGTNTLSLAGARTSDDGIALFELPRQKWDFARLSEVTRTSDARWILFQEAGASHEAVEDLLPLFADHQTFAVSRQNSFRGWQDLLIPAAPFRELQPEEATQVFAPVSKQILVDRQKLLELGVPQLSGYGSNWYLLFWKAAAAGWKSYSVGTREPLREAVDVPFYEAQFVHALLVDEFLGRLKPRDPLLARGNISRWTAGSMGFRKGFPRVMVLSPYLPYPLSHGGAVRMFNLSRALAPRIDYVLVCFREKNDHVDYEKLHEVFREVYVLGIDELHGDASLPAQVSGYESTSMRALIPELCFKQRIDLLQVEYTQMAAYRETVPHLPAILVEHDITFTLHRQLSEREPTAQALKEYRNWLRFEGDRLRAFDMVWTMSEYDRQQAIGAGSAADKTVVVANGVDLERYSCGPEAENGREILYIGSFRHKPNYLGFEELRNSIMPDVWREFPDARLCVVAGPDHEKHWHGQRELDPRITVLGFVENLAPLYERCSVVAVPLPVSAGTNIKLMEALSCQRAVVTTQVGCVGLGLSDGVEVLIRELSTEFGQAINLLLGDFAWRKSIAAAGRKTAEQRFGWSHIGDQAAEAYAALLGAL